MQTIHDISEKLNAVYNTMVALYDTIGVVSDFIKTMTQWFGFGPLIALVGLLFFFKIYQSVFPVSRVINVIFSFGSLTALWLTWNMKYYKDYHLLDVARIYGTILLYAAALFLAYWLLHQTGKFIHRRILKQKLSLDNTLFLYEKIDELTLAIKQKLKVQDVVGASAALEELQQSFKDFIKK